MNIYQDRAAICTVPEATRSKLARRRRVTDYGIMASVRAADDLRDEDARMSPPADGGFARWGMFSKPVRRFSAISIDTPAPVTIDTCMSRNEA